MCLLLLRLVEEVLTVVVAHHAHVALMSHSNCTTKILRVSSVIRTALLRHPRLHVPLYFPYSNAYLVINRSI